MSAKAQTVSTTAAGAGYHDGVQRGGKLAIGAGGGELPAAIAQAAREAGYDVFILGFIGNASRSIEAFPHAYVHVGQLGRFLNLLRQHNCTGMVPVGSLRRPDFFKTRIDLGLVRHLPRLLRILKGGGGDDAVLRGFAKFFEDQGVTIRAAHEIAPQLLAPEGVFSHAAPLPGAERDIAVGLEVLAAISAFDIGQSVAVARGRVLAVEAAEGTDAMLKRCAGLRGAEHKPGGVLVKAPKLGQDLRFDLPTIGPRTVELAAEAGLAGIAVAAGAVLLAEQGALVDKAAKLGLFLCGVGSNGKAPTAANPGAAEAVA